MFLAIVITRIPTNFAYDYNYKSGLIRSYSSYPSTSLNT